MRKGRVGQEQVSQRWGGRRGGTCGGKREAATGLVGQVHAPGILVDRPAKALPLDVDGGKGDLVRLLARHFVRVDVPAGGPHHVRLEAAVVLEVAVCVVVARDRAAVGLGQEVLVDSAAVTRHLAALRGVRRLLHKGVDSAVNWLTLEVCRVGEVTVAVEQQDEDA
jgi:hypothetical protein